MHAVDEAAGLNERPGVPVTDGPGRADAELEEDHRRDGIAVLEGHLEGRALVGLRG